MQAKAPVVSQVAETSGVRGWPQEKVMSAAPEEKETESLSGGAGDKLCFPFLALTLSLLSNKPREGSQPRGGSSAV